MKINTLQILRAIAAISVLVTHVFQNLEYKPFGSHYLSGQYGVDIFFMLSGFLIYLTTKKDTQPMVYAKKRIFRIYPLYIFALFLYVLLGIGKYPFNYTVKSFFQNILMFPWDKSIGYDSLVVGVAWSTVFEMFFYILFFVIIIFNISKKAIFVIIPALILISKIIIYFVLEAGNEIPFLSLFLSLSSSTHLFMFLIGCLICELYINNKIPIINKKLYTFLLFFFCAITIIMLMLNRNFLVSFVVCSSLFILIIQFERYYQLKTKTKIVRLLINWGDISFSIYIFHILFIRVFIEYLGVSNVPILLVFTLVSTILFSNLTYKWIEKPFMDAGKGEKGLVHHFGLIFKKT